MVLIAAFIVVMAGIASGAIPDSDGVIHACYKNVSGQLRVIDPAVSECGNGETPLSWNQEGPAGPPSFPDYELRRNQEYIAPGQVAEVSVPCSEGKRVLGGGYTIETPKDVLVFGSAPHFENNFDTRHWSVIVQNVGLLTRQVNVAVICAVIPGQP
jgi:hypothetical protein